MTSLSHTQAREFIQQSHLAEEDGLALRQHLAACAECRTYAATHIQLGRQLHLDTVRSRPTPAQRAAILDATVKRPAPFLWRPLAATGSLAAIAFLAIAFWLLFSAADSMTTSPALPAPLATLLSPFINQPVLTPVATDLVPNVAPAPTATPAGTPDPRGRFVTVTVPAPSLAGNLVGEPLAQEVTVYLPPSYDGSDRRYPVVYALLTNNRAGDYIRSAMNLALRNGAPEMIIVSPAPLNVLNLSNLYVDSAVFGDWEAFIAEDLIPYVDATYRTIPTAESRGLFAMFYRSLGGLAIAARYPGLIGSLYLSYPMLGESGNLGDLHGHIMSDLARPRVIEFIAEARQWPAESAVSSLQEALAPPLHTMTQDFMDAIAYGMTFVPAVESGAPYFEYPYATPDGQPDPAIMQRWENGMADYLERVWPHAGSLQGTDILIINDDQVFALNYLSESLTAAGVDHSLVTRSWERSSSELIDFGQEALGRFFTETLSIE